MGLPSFDDRLNLSTQLMKEASKHSEEDLKNAATAFYYKLVMSEAYKPSSKFKGEVTLVKAKENYVQLEADYGLSPVIFLILKNYFPILKSKLGQLLHIYIANSG